jgi:hypothetical protein
MKSPKFPSNRRFPKYLDDMISEDNRSYKSGMTGKNSRTDLDSFNNFRQEPTFDQPIAPSGNRNMMKPPLRKRETSTNSIQNNQTTTRQRDKTLNDDGSIKFSQNMIESFSNLDMPDNQEGIGWGITDKNSRKQSLAQP